MDTDSLIRLAHQGDAAAWELMVRDHQQAVFRLAYLLLRNADDAEDIAQDTFIRAFRSLHTFDPARPLRPWLLQIAANLARNRQRSLRRYLAALGRWLSSEPAAISGSDRSGDQWEADQLWQAIGQLRTQDREILYLRYFLDLTEHEMSNTLQIAPGTVKSRLHRAIQRLRVVIDGGFPQLREERGQ